MSLGEGDFLRNRRSKSHMTINPGFSLSNSQRDSKSVSFIVDDLPILEVNNRGPFPFAEMSRTILNLTDTASYLLVSSPTIQGQGRHSEHEDYDLK
jgi:hypothetical protein